MRKRKQTKKLLLVNFFLWAIPMTALLMLPLYYKFIWPPMIGKPASASTVDVLAFWGAMFSGIITLVGVYLTIRFSQGEIEVSIGQQERDQFIRGFGATVLELNSIQFETKKFRNYLQQLKANLEEYGRTGTFNEIFVEFDTKDDYKKIRNQVKPELEIICNRFEGKAAHADGFVYYQVSILSAAIKDFQARLHHAVDQLHVSAGKKKSIKNLESMFQELDVEVDKCVKSLKDYKAKLGERFIEYSKEDGYME